MGAIKNRCVVICASPAPDLDLIRNNIREDDYIICADGGFDTIRQIGIVPDLLVGDFDSLSVPFGSCNSEIIKLNVDKDDTDTMHCAVEAIKRGYKNLLFLCATGGRLDHTLANLSVLLYLRNNGAQGKLLDKYNDIRLLNNGMNHLLNKRGLTVSVLPFSCSEATLTYKGLRYPMTHQTVRIDYPFTISNVVEEDDAQIILHSGTALLIIVST